VLNTDEVVIEERGRLFGIAYRMLGTVPDAEDAVQETLIKWHQADRAQIEHPGGWLTTVITRYCIDQLRSARARRETYMGTWLPDPILAGDSLLQADPSERVALDESVSMAMLVVLETLSPAERAVLSSTTYSGSSSTRSARWLAEQRPPVGSSPRARAGTSRSAVRGSILTPRSRGVWSPLSSMPATAATSRGCWHCSIRLL
jgi:RNA polymerase sigma factor (sigma-70 family)